MHYPLFSISSVLRVGLATVCFVFLPEAHSRLSAGESEWIGDQNEITPGIYPPGWAFNDGTMWQGFLRPISESDDAIFGGSYAPSPPNGPYRWDDGGTIFFGDFASNHAPLKGGPTQIQQVDAVNRTVRIQSGEWTFDFDAFAFPTSESIGSDRGSYTITNILNVGDRVKATGEAGTATLSIVNSGLHTTTTQVGRGSVNETPIVGTLNILGTDTVWENSADITVGHDEGEGYFSIGDGASVSARNLVVGLVGGDGHATASNGSTLDLSGALNVGVLASFGGGGPTATGKMTISGGSTVNSAEYSYIGTSVGAKGHVVVTGTDSVWSNQNGLNLGGEGDGTIEILDGGMVHTTSAVGIGSGGGVGHVKIDGTFGHISTWSVEGIFGLVNGDLSIGTFGRLEQSNGMMVLGQTSETSTIEVLVGGELLTSNVYIARNGLAEVNSHGRIKTSGEARIGTTISSSGTVTITGDDAEWLIDSDLIVGEKGQGEVIVRNDGVMKSQTGRIGVEANSIGAVHLESGASWQVANSLSVGEGGTGGLLLSGTTTHVEVGNALYLGENGRIAFDSNEGHINVGENAEAPIPQGTIRVGAGGFLYGGGIIDGNVIVDGGVISPGFSPGLMSINGNLLVGPAGSLNVEIGGTVSGLDYDVLDVSGDIDIDGTVLITFIQGFRPHEGATFGLFQFGGTFAPMSKDQFAFMNAPTGFEYELAFDSGVTSVVVTVPEVSSLSLLCVASVFVGLAVRYRQKCVLTTLKEVG